MHWLLEHEALFRLGCFSSVFVLMVIGELALPYRQQAHKPQRWLNNLGLMLLNTLVLRLLFPAAAIGIAFYAQQHEIGLLNGLLNQLNLNDHGFLTLVVLVVSVLLLDMLIYWQHRLFHQIPLLWRLHRVHHSDRGFDISTGVRFHPLEIVLSMLIKGGLILLIGVSPIAVLLFETLLSSCAIFNHGNVRLPAALDRLLRKILVTPDMHRIHHSEIINETNSNYGFSITWWDKLFGSYCVEAAAGKENIVLGLSQYRQPERVNRFTALLMMPFR